MGNARLMVNSDDGQRKYSGIVDCIRTVLRKEGVGAFFAGVGGAFGTVLASAIQLSCYEQVKKMVERTSPALLQTAAGVFLIGALCKCFAVFATFPLTTVGSRLQNQRKEEGSDKKVRYSGTVDCFINDLTGRVLFVISWTAAQVDAAVLSEWIQVPFLRTNCCVSFAPDACTRHEMSAPRSGYTSYWLHLLYAPAELYISFHSPCVHAAQTKRQE